MKNLIKKVIARVRYGRVIFVKAYNSKWIGEVDRFDGETVCLKNAYAAYVSSVGRVKVVGPFIRAEVDGPKISSFPKNIRDDYAAADGGKATKPGAGFDYGCDYRRWA